MRMLLRLMSIFSKKLHVIYEILIIHTFCCSNNVLNGDDLEMLVWYYLQFVKENLGYRKWFVWCYLADCI
jgi:hypothetical protein